MGAADRVRNLPPVVTDVPGDAWGWLDSPSLGQRVINKVLKSCHLHLVPQLHPAAASLGLER